MVAAVQSATPSLFLNVSRLQNLRGALAVPVEPVYTLESQFEHVQGVPTRGAGVPLFKLRVLDNLIDRLLSLREDVPARLRLETLPGGEEIEPLITALEERLRSRVLQHGPAFGGQFPETGMLVDLAA